MQGKIPDSLNLLRKIIEKESIYKEIIKKDKDFDRLKDNQLFKELFREKSEFDKLDKNQVFKQVIR